MSLIAAIAAVIKQGRAIEVAYSLYSLIIHRPGITVSTFDPIAISVLSSTSHVEPEDIAFQQYQSSFPRLSHWLCNVPLRLHTVAEIGELTLAGEYGEGSARIFVMDDVQCSVTHYYNNRAGVRHIHCIHAISDDAFVITTGDSQRSADLWRIEDGKIRFDRTILRLFGGFTAATRAGGHDYFGSDYSGRPNYLWRMADGKKFFLPSAIFHYFVDNMFTVEDRYIVVVAKQLDTAGGGRKAALFDTEIGRFVTSGL
jgi:hypothetical protein